MRTPRALPLLSLCAALAASALAARAETDLGPLLDGFERCEANAAFSALSEAVTRRFANGYGEKVARDDTSVALPIPASVKAALGAPRSALHDDYTSVSFDLAGSFKGFKVTRLTITMGNENGIGLHVLEFDAPLASLRQRFGKSLASANRKANAGESAGVSFGLSKKPPAAIVCDFSN